MGKDRDGACGMGTSVSARLVAAQDLLVVGEVLGRSNEPVRDLVEELNHLFGRVGEPDRKDWRGR